jgi:hypothetical protein
MARYGQTYKVAEFISKLVSRKRTIVKNDQNYFHACINFLMQLDIVQDDHPWVTFSFSAADGLWVYYKGESICFLKPTQKYLFLHVFEQNNLSKKIDDQKKYFQKVVETSYAHKQWHLGVNEMEWLVDHFKGSPRPIGEQSFLSEKKHPRYISGHIRQAALDDFLASGRQCPGVGIMPHKVPQNELIEFDHIMPHSAGGPNIYSNIQVLCMKCNRTKGASAR